MYAVQQRALARVREQQRRRLDGARARAAEVEEAHARGAREADRAQGASRRRARAVGVPFDAACRRASASSGRSTRRGGGSPTRRRRRARSSAGTRSRRRRERARGGGGARAEGGGAQGDGGGGAARGRAGSIHAAAARRRDEAAAARRREAISRSQRQAEEDLRMAREAERRRRRWRRCYGGRRRRSSASTPGAREEQRMAQEEYKEAHTAARARRRRRRVRGEAHACGRRRRRRWLLLRLCGAAGEKGARFAAMEEAGTHSEQQLLEAAFDARVLDPEWEARADPPADAEGRHEDSDEGMRQITLRSISTHRTASQTVLYPHPIGAFVSPRIIRQAAIFSLNTRTHSTIPLEVGILHATHLRLADGVLAHVSAHLEALLPLEVDDDRVVLPLGIRHHELAGGRLHLLLAAVQDQLGHAAVVPAVGRPQSLRAMSRRPVALTHSRSPTALAVVLRFIQLTFSASSTLPSSPSTLMHSQLPLKSTGADSTPKTARGELAEPDAARQAAGGGSGSTSPSGNTSRLMGRSVGRVP